MRNIQTTIQEETITHTYYEGASSSICVLFPGFGYHEQRPLLQSALSIAQSYHMNVLCLSYGHRCFDKEHLDETIAQCEDTLYEHAMQAIAQVSKINTVHSFISKSFGTILAARAAQEIYCNVSAILLTPLKQPLPYLRPQDIVCLGDVRSLCF